MSQENKIQKVAEIFLDYLNAQEASCVNARRQIAELFSMGSVPEQKTAVREEVFTSLKFEPQQGAKIGAYDVAYKANNIVDKWTSAFNILRQSNATIQSRCRGVDYQFSYWLYGTDKIYRQKHKEAQP